MTDLQNRLKAVEDAIPGPGKPYAAAPGETPLASVERRLSNVEWAVKYLARILRKHLETDER